MVELCVTPYTKDLSKSPPAPLCKTYFPGRITASGKLCLLVPTLKHGPEGYLYEWYQKLPKGLREFSGLLFICLTA